MELKKNDIRVDLSPLILKKGTSRGKEKKFKIHCIDFRFCDEKTNSLTHIYIDTHY